MILDDNEKDLPNLLEDVVIVTARGKYVKCKTVGQKKYVESIKKNDVVFGIGPAGTGKTYLAIAMAVKFLREKKVARIILTRPAVEAGERLGFLPGDLQEKINPYLKPLYDSLYDILGQETFQKYMESGIIEVAPLAYMRGRTLDDSFIILDEAQNTTPEQIKMFLTRFGFGSRIVVTGDITQVDLGYGKVSGLKQVIKILKDISGIDFMYFTHKDIVRHKLVMEIIKAYEKYDNERDKDKNIEKYYRDDETR
jgi:phosphate starvation-inducible PhoH-like protein